MRPKRRRIIVGSLGLGVLLAAFLLVRIVPAHRDPPLDIQADGSERALARSVLENELRKLFRGSNGTWLVAGRSRSQCASKVSATSIGRADTTPYEFARWLGVRLFDYVYPNRATARRAFDGIETRQQQACRARVFAEELRQRGYSVGKAHGFSSTGVRIADAARSVHFEMPSQFKGRSYTWHLDSTEVLQGRMVVAVGTVVAGPFAEGEQGLAGALAKAAGSQR
jgi:hypothetical protein